MWALILVFGLSILHIQAQQLQGHLGMVLVADYDYSALITTTSFAGDVYLKTACDQKENGKRDHRSSIHFQ